MGRLQRVPRFGSHHKLRAGKNAGTPFLGSASRKERLSVLDSGQICSLVKSTAGTGLTIRSSRARFAASALPAMIGASPMPRSGPA